MINTSNAGYYEDVVKAQDMISYYTKYHPEMIELANAIEISSTIHVIAREGDVKSFINIFKSRLNNMVSIALQPYKDYTVKCGKLNGSLFDEEIFPQVWGDVYNGIEVFLINKFKGSIDPEVLFEEIANAIHQHIKIIIEAICTDSD